MDVDILITNYPKQCLAYNEVYINEKRLSTDF